MSDRYYVELARDSLNKAVNELRHAEQFLINADATEAVVSISRIIGMVEKRNKELRKELCP